MSTIEIGDIVSYARERWVAFRYEQRGMLIRIRRWRRGHLESRLARPSALTLVARPTFAVGQKVIFNGVPARVVEDRGAVVRVEEINPRRALPGGGHIRWPVTGCDMPRADLVLDNLELALR